jgi:hypothetical protein
MELSTGTGRQPHNLQASLVTEALKDALAIFKCLQIAMREKDIRDSVVANLGEFEVEQLQGLGSHEGVWHAKKNTWMKQNIPNKG